MKQDSAFFCKIPIENLSKELIQIHNYTSGHLNIISQLFFAQADLIYTAEKFRESLDYYERSVILLDFVIIESGTFYFQKQSKQQYIRSRINEIEQDKT